VRGFELWKSDGTAAGTILVKDIDPINDYSHINPGNLTNLNGTLLFTVDDGAHGYELWRSDGTAAGTTLVKDIYPGNRSAYPRQLTEFNGEVFFSAIGEVHGFELWKTDGTAAGTMLVKDTSSAADSLGVADLTNVNGSLLFTALDVQGYRALWSSDGTSAGTRPLQRVAPADDYEWPTRIRLSGNSLFVTINDAASGRELWAIPAGAGTGAVIVAPGRANGASAGFAAISINYLNTGLTAAQSFTLTATLDPRLVYAGDASGATPAVSGSTITWRLPSAGFLQGRDFLLRLRLPEAPLGTRLPVALRLTAVGPDGQASTDTAQAEVMVADLQYLPVAR
jgi:ELWxxDGT repeat protein